MDKNQFLMKILIYFYIFTSVNVRADDDSYNPNQDTFNFVITTFIPFMILYGLYLIKRQKFKENEKIKNKFLIYFEGLLTDIGIIISCFIVPLIGFYFTELPIKNYRVFIYGNCSSLLACVFLIIYFWLIDIFAHKSFRHLRDGGHLLQYNLLLIIPFACMDIFYIIFAFSVDYLSIKIIVLTYYGISIICKSITKIKFGDDRINFLKYTILISLLAYLVFTCYLSAVFLSTNFYQTKIIFLIETFIIFRIIFYFEDKEDNKNENKNEIKEENEEDETEDKDLNEDEEKRNTIMDEKRPSTHGYINYLMTFKKGDEQREYKRRPTLFIWIACVILPFVIFLPILFN